MQSVSCFHVSQKSPWKKTARCMEYRFEPTESRLQCGEIPSLDFLILFFNTKRITRKSGADMGHDSRAPKKGRERPTPSIERIFALALGKMMFGGTV